MTRTGLEPAPDADAFLSTRPTVPVVATDWLLEVRITSRGHGATAARLTPDQKVGSSNLSALIAHHLRRKGEGRGRGKERSSIARIVGQSQAHFWAFSTPRFRPICNQRSGAVVSVLGS